METAPRNCRFLSLVVVARVLTHSNEKNTCFLAFVADSQTAASWGEGKKKDAAFLLTVGSFLLTVELFYLQLTILAFLLTVGAFFAYSFSFFTRSWSSFAYSGKVRLIRALRDCKQRSLTVSKKAPTVSKKTSSEEKLLTPTLSPLLGGSSLGGPLGAR